MPVFTPRGHCTFIMHPTWQEQHLWKNLSLHHFGEFLEKFECPDLSFVSKFFSIFFLKLLISKNANIYATGPLYLHYASHVAGTRFLKKFVHPPFSSIFLKNLHVRTLVFFQNFSTLFLKLSISKSANIHATGPLHLYFASHGAGTRILKNFVYPPFWWIFGKICMSGP